MKVCTQGTTYAEFREKRLALETYYTANRSALADQSADIGRLIKIMRATDTIWNFEIEYPNIALPSWGGQPWPAMQDITPSVAKKYRLPIDQCERDPDFYAPNYVRRGLTEISEECDDLLK